MKAELNNIATLSTGLYAQPDILADTYYLQANHFLENGLFDTSVKPLVKLENKYEKHLLSEGDILFAAKGQKNFAVIYHSSIGQAVASSSFIIIKIRSEFKKLILPEYLAWYLNSSNQIEVFQKVKSTSTIPSISIAQLSQMEINIPNIDKQKGIIKIDELRKQEKEIIKKIDFNKEQLIREIISKAITK